MHEVKGAVKNMPNTNLRHPVPGQLIDVNGHRLHIQCAGEGETTVILEAGQAGFSLDWMRVIPDVAHFARVCAYDRAGMGWSEAGPAPRTPQRVVSELHALLVNAAIPKPYILVAHSLGGRYARLYAHEYPEEVKGLVLVDPDQECYGEALGADKYQQYVSKRSSQYKILGTLARLGIIRLLGKNVLGMLLPEMRDADPETRQRYAEIAARPEAMRIAVEEYEQAVAADAELKAAGMPQNIPVTILAHGIPWPYPEYEQAWQDGLKQLAALSPQGQLVVAEKSGHAIMLAQPELVVDAIRQVLETTTQRG